MIDADYASVVRANHQKTVGYLVASREPCLTIRDDEVRLIQRRLVALQPDGLANLVPEASWLMGVILCPGDDASDAAAFARREKASSRIRFYLHPDTDAAAALAPWADAGLPPPRAEVVSSWQELHPDFGRALNDRVYADHRP